MTVDPGVASEKLTVPFVIVPEMLTTNGYIAFADGAGSVHEGAGADDGAGDATGPRSMKSAVKLAFGNVLTYC